LESWVVAFMPYSEERLSVYVCSRCMDALKGDVHVITWSFAETNFTGSSSTAMMFLVRSHENCATTGWPKKWGHSY